MTQGEPLRQAHHGGALSCFQNAWRTSMALRRTINKLIDYVVYHTFETVDELGRMGYKMASI